VAKSHRYALALYFLTGHTFRGCARKFGCTAREAEDAYRWVVLRTRKRGWKP